MLSGPHVQDFRLMKAVFDSWLQHTSRRLQGAAALAAGEAAAAYHNSRLKVKAWSAWQAHVQQVRWCGLGGAAAAFAAWGRRTVCACDCAGQTDLL